MKKIPHLARFVFVMFAAAALIIAGLLAEQQSQVLSKAVRICLECIGIG